MTAPSGESNAGEGAMTDPAGDAAEEARKQRIKIGTQRPGVAVPRVEPRTKVAFRTPPIEPAPAAKSSPATPAGTAVASPPVQSEPVEAQQPSTDAVSPQPAAAPVKFKEKPRRSRFEMTTAPVEKVEKPNLRAALSPELEAELQQALGEQPLDEIIAGEAMGAPTGEMLETETRMKGRVLRIFRDDVFVDLGGRNQGVLTLHALAQEPEVGAELDVTVNRFNAEDGLYELTTAGSSVDVGDWSDISEGITVEAAITGHNKGGLECEVNKIRGFIPAGQISKNSSASAGPASWWKPMRTDAIWCLVAAPFWSANNPRRKKN
jgi:small subunit ribosomal protein S1